MSVNRSSPRIIVESSPVRALAVVMASEREGDRRRKGVRSIAIISRPLDDRQRRSIALAFARFAPACELWGVQTRQKPALSLIRSGRTEQVAVDPGTLRQHSRMLRLVRPDGTQVIEGKPLANLPIGK